MANVIIRWHNLFGMQQHIQNVVGKCGRVLPSNESDTQASLARFSTYKNLMLKKQSGTFNYYHLSEQRLSLNLL